MNNKESDSEHHHSHGHGNSHHGHSHGNLTGTKLALTIVINILITAAQIAGGIASGSLALVSDALHNFSDVMALIISYIAEKLSGRKFSAKKTFGYKRGVILAAMVNAAALIGIGGYLIFSAVERFIHPEVIDSIWVIGLALFSIFGNGVSVLLLKGEAADSLNIKSAYLHLLTDVMTSVAVLLGGLVMSVYQIYWLDSVLSILIALYLIHASWGILMETLRVVMQFAPAHLDIREIEKTILSSPEMHGVHHVHLWQLDDKTINLEAHLHFKEDISLSETNQVIKKINLRLQEKFGINHTIFQSEFDTNHALDLLYNSVGG